MYTIAASLLGIILMIFIVLPLYIFFKRSKKEGSAKIAVILKGSITLIALLYCVAGWQRAGAETDGSTLPWFMNSFWPVAGLLLCLAADVLLEIVFFAGMGLFFLGHVCYILFFIQIGKVSMAAIPVFLILETVMVLYFWQYHKKLGKSTIAYMLYGSLILVTFSFGIFLPFTAGEMGVLPAMAAVLLVISDYMLAYQIIVKKSEFREVVLLGFYWAGQYCMAMSLFLPVYLYDL